MDRGADPVERPDGLTLGRQQQHCAHDTASHQVNAAPDTGFIAPTEAIEATEAIAAIDATKAAAVVPLNNPKTSKTASHMACSGNPGSLVLPT
jgi:hypothetical protein